MTVHTNWPTQQEAAEAEKLLEPLAPNFTWHRAGACMLVQSAAGSSRRYVMIHSIRHATDPADYVRKCFA